ncbi:MAG: 50S ribosomal protein L3 [Burkholderiales bacterium]
MSLGLLGRKVGMTRLFSDDGDAVPVTVVDVSNNRVSQVKTVESDGYTAVQIAYGKRRPIRVTKAMAGHFAKAGVEAGSILREFRVTPDQATQLKAGSAVGVDIFKEGQMVDVGGQTQGKGFAGVIRRHHFRSNRASHGNSASHNTPGSTGQRQDPGRVFPGKKMPGHLGDVSVTTQNLKIVRIDTQRQLLMIRGALPGSRGGNVVVTPASRGGA